MDLNFNPVYEGTPPWDIGCPQRTIVQLEEVGESRAQCSTGSMLRVRLVWITSTPHDVSLDEPIAFVLTNNSVYINSLVFNFEWFWEQAIPAEQRIEELLKESPPQI